MTYPVIACYQIGVDEEKPVAADVSCELLDVNGVAGYTITGLNWFVTPDDGIITLRDSFINGQYIGVYVTAPEASQVYRLKAVVTAETTAAVVKIFDVLFQINGIEK